MYLMIQLGEPNTEKPLAQIGLSVSEDMVDRLGSKDPLVVIRALFDVSEDLLVKAETRMEELPNGAFAIGKED